RSRPVSSRRRRRRSRARRTSEIRRRDRGTRPWARLRVWAREDPARQTRRRSWAPATAIAVPWRRAVPRRNPAAATVRLADRLSKNGRPGSLAAVRYAHPLTPLSAKTRQHLESMFAPADRAAGEQALLGWSEGDSGRLRFGALRLSRGELPALDDAIKLGRLDWRDLLMAADFGDVGAHEAWVPRRFTPQIGETWLAGREIDGVKF